MRLGEHEENAGTSLVTHMIAGTVALHALQRLMVRHFSDKIRDA
jgi:hypothetical protein